MPAYLHNGSEWVYDGRLEISADNPDLRGNIAAGRISRSRIIMSCPNTTHHGGRQEGFVQVYNRTSAGSYTLETEIEHPNNSVDTGERNFGNRIEVIGKDPFVFSSK